MTDLSFIKDELFRQILTEGIEQAPTNKSYVALHVSSWHMSVFCEYYDNLGSIENEKGNELIDPMCYSHIQIVYDLKNNELLYVDKIGLISNAFDYWKENKDKPKPQPVPPPIYPSLTEDSLLNLADKKYKSFKKHILKEN